MNFSTPSLRGWVHKDPTKRQEALQIVRDAMLRHGEFPEDLVDEGIADLWVAIERGKYNPTMSLRGFAYGILKHKLRESARWRQAVKLASELSDTQNGQLAKIPAPIADPVSKMLPKCKDVIRTIIATKVDKRYRTIALLRFVRGLKSAEIARTLKMQKQHVRDVVKAVYHKHILPGVRQAITEGVFDTMTTVSEYYFERRPPP